MLMILCLSFGVFSMFRLGWAFRGWLPFEASEDGFLRGTVSVLAATTGLVLKTIAVGYQPSALAVDEPTGHVFVTSQSASVPGHGAFAALIERVQEFMAVTPGSSRGIVTILNAGT